MELIRRHSKPLADWAQSFLLSTYSFDEQKSIEKEAAINVKSLPKVVWNENVFYVALDSGEENADIFNEYGNVVTALHNVSSIEDVERRLNRKVVASSQDGEEITANNNLKKVVKLDDELLKVADEITTDDPSINGSQNNVTNTPVDTSSNITQEQMDNASTNTGTTQQTTASVKNQLQTFSKADSQALSHKFVAAKLKSVIKQQVNLQLKEQNNTQINSLKKELNSYKKKVASLQSNFKRLAEAMNVLTDQIHAYNDPGNVYDLNSMDVEAKHYHDTAYATAKGIEAERGVDLTTPRGRSSLQSRILQDIGEIKMPNEILSEVNPTNNLEGQVNTPPVTIEIIDTLPKGKDNNIPTEELDIPDVDTDKVTVIDVTSTADGDDDADGNDGKIDVNIKNEEDTAKSKAKSKISDEEDFNFDLDFDAKDTGKKDKKISEKDDDDNDDDLDLDIDFDFESLFDEDDAEEKKSSKKKANLSVKRLSKQASKVFKSQKCPICREQYSLQLGNRSNQIQHVNCECCHAKFGVDLDTEIIYKY